MKLAWLTVALTACAMDSPRPQDTVPPTDAASADLTFLREEEKLARDVYRTLYQEWQLTPHANIAESEQTHMNRVLSVLEAHGLPDPVSSDEVGAFKDPRLAALYGSLVEKGKTSPVASLEVGATIEDLDLRDLQAMRQRTADPLTLGMLDALECGSKNHLRAFYRQLTAAGVSYQAQYLPQPQLDEIVASAQERCGLRTR